MMPSALRHSATGVVGNLALALALAWGMGHWHCIGTDIGMALGVSIAFSLFALVQTFRHGLVATLNWTRFELWRRVCSPSKTQGTRVRVFESKVSRVPPAASHVQPESLNIHPPSACPHTKNTIAPHFNCEVGACMFAGNSLAKRGQTTKQPKPKKKKTPLCRVASWRGRY